MQSVADISPPKLSGLDLVRLSQGFSCVFWGLPVSLLFCVQFLLTETVVLSPEMRASLAGLHFSLFVAALVVVCFGAWRLGRVRVFGARWRRWSAAALCCALLCLYFTPFLYWWQAQPEEWLYTVNVFGQVLAVIALLIVLNLLCIELGRFLGDRSLVRESQVFLGLNAVVLALPSSAAFTWSAIASARLGDSASVGLEFLRIFRLYESFRMPIFVVLFLPVSLTLANLWRVKDMLVDELKKLPAA
jgi:hypothetical protein